MMIPELNKDKDVAQLIKIGKLFEQRGWFLGTSGNMSVIVSRSPLSFAITASGLDKGNLTEDDFINIDGNGNPCNHLSGSTNNKRPSDEYSIHFSIYQSTSAQCVIHVHVVSGLLIADWYASEGKVELRELEILKGLGSKDAGHSLDLAIVNNKDNIQELANDIARVITQYKEATAPAVLVRNHGMFVWGDSVFAAKRHVELLTHAFEYLIFKKSLWAQ